MRSHHLALPLALIVGWCFQDIISDSGADSPDTAVTETPVVPAGGTADTEPTQDSSSEGSSSTDESSQGANEGSSGSAAEPQCGDGTLDPNESCDDGNVSSGDGCSPTCAVESRACRPGIATIGEDLERGIGVCKDNSDSTCEMDFTSLCAAEIG